VPGLTAA